MGTGILALACLSIMVGQTPEGATYTNRRSHEIPLNFQESARAGIKEVLLYASTDRGRNWGRVGVVPASKDRFTYYAPADGTYWFQVAIVNHQGKQNPDDKSLMQRPPDLMMIIDTVQPVVKSIQAQRQGDEIYVAWDVQEDHPDLGKDGLRLDYQVKDSLGDLWTPIPSSPSLKGTATFRPTSNQTLVVRLTVRDRAGNQSYGMAEVAGTVAAAGFAAPTNPRIQAPNFPDPVLPMKLVLPKAPENDLRPPGVLPDPPKMDLTPAKIESMPPKSFGGNPGGLILPPPPQQSLLRPQPQPVKDVVAEKVVADSRTPVEPVKPPQPIAPPGGIRPALGDGGFDIKPVANAVLARKPLPNAQFMRTHQVLLQYRLNRVGPSGIGGVELWLTKDDGDTWERYAEDKEVSTGPVQGNQERSFDLRDRETDVPFPDGVYGMSLVVKNRAGMGKKPRPGDAPEIRIELDTQPPVAQLFMPTADPQHPDQLLIKWSAHDKNLTAAPVNLEFSERREGPWSPIKLELANTGRYTNQHVTGDYSWKVPPNTPVQVYLRLRVSDKAGNESVAVTAEPQFVDLVEPEGALIGVQPQPKRP